MITTRSATGWTVDYEQYNPRLASSSLEAYADRDIQTVNIDTVGTTVELTPVVGVSDSGSRSTKAEALAGVVNLKVAGGVGVNVTLTDQSGHSIVKAFTSDINTDKTVPQLIKLLDADIGSGQSQLGDGTITVRAVATAADAAGNPGVISTSSFILDTKVDAVNMSVTAASGRSNTTKPTLTGTGEVGATVKIRDGSNTGTEVATATVGTDGTWSATVTTPLTEGVHQLYASIQDIAGNIASPLAAGGVVARSLTHQTATTTEKIGVTIGNNDVHEVLRGVGVTVLNVDGSFKTHNVYDAYNDARNINDALSTSLINKLNTTNYGVGEKVIITTNDDWVVGFSNAARDALIGIGASSSLIGASTTETDGTQTKAKFRSSFVMITQKTGNGWAVDYQDYQPESFKDPLVAYGDSNIQTVKILTGATSLVADNPIQSDSTSEFGAMDTSWVYNGNTYVMAKSKLNHDVLDAKLGDSGGDTTVALTESTKTAVKGVDTSYASVLRDGKTYVLLDTAELKEVLQQPNASLWDASTKLANGEGFWTANQTASNAHAYIADSTHQIYAGADALDKWTVFKVL
jgi:hypothetical protein